MKIRSIKNPENTQEISPENWENIKRRGEDKNWIIVDKGKPADLEKPAAKPVDLTKGR